MAEYIHDATRRVTTHDLMAMKRGGRKIAMITAYDALFGALVDSAGVDVILVGDSVVCVLAGEATSIPATMDQMIYHGRIVERGVKHALLVVDLPFLSYQVSIPDAIANAGRILKETGAQAVKLEGGAAWAPTIAALVRCGIPVMGHAGFTPQSVNQLEGIKIQGKEADAATRLIEDAKALEEAGAFAIVLEFIPGGVAQRVSEAVAIPTIGIAAGVHCDGQVLVLHDMLGLNEGFAPKFLRRYAELGRATREAVGRYCAEVRGGQYPGLEHTYGE